MHIIAIVGSLRKESINRKLANYIKNRYRDRFDLEILDLADIPMYNQDIEMDTHPTVQSFKQKVSNADAVLWLTPEYNYSIPGVLKNAIDWLSRVDQVMKNKPSFIMGASGGAMGTVRAQLHLREILFATGIRSPLLPSNEVYISFAQQKFNEQGQLTDESTIAHLDNVIANFLSWYQSYTR